LRGEKLTHTQSRADERMKRRCGSRGECAHDGVAAEARARLLVGEVARVLDQHHGVLVLVRPWPLYDARCMTHEA
jgi:hypothetical protein